MDFEKVLEGVREDMSEIKDMLGVDAELTVTGDSEQDGKYVINISFDGDELGYMIGSRGRHLRSLQFIVSLMVNNKYSTEDTRYFVHVDVSGYRDEREQKVEELAMRAADDARILGEPVDLDPMNPADRRVVHTVLGKFDDLTTESQGEGRDRYVRIIPFNEDDIVAQGLDDGEGEGEEQES